MLKKTCRLLVFILLLLSPWMYQCGEGSQTNGDNDADCDTDTQNDSDSSVDTDSNTDTDSDANTDNDIDTDTETDTDSDTNTDIDTDTDADTESGSDTDSEACAIDSERIYQHTAFLASDECTGRKPGTPGSEKALQYTEDVFRQYGFEPAGDNGTYRQAFSVAEYKVTGRPSLEIDGVTWDSKRDFRVIAGSGSGAVRAELVFVGYGLVVPPYDPQQHPRCPIAPSGYDDFEGVGTLSGKIAVALQHGPNDSDAIFNACPPDPSVCRSGAKCLFDFGHKAAWAKKHGAKALLIVQDFQSKHDALPQGQYLGAAYDATDFPVLFVSRTRLEQTMPQITEWAQKIDRDLRPHSRATGVVATLDVQMQRSKVETENVLGQLKGQDPTLGKEVIVMGGHIDHLGEIDGVIYPGADDNAAGPAVIMEIARMFSACGIRPKRTVVLAAWNAEEMGLHGSNHYVNTSPTYPIKDTIAYFNLDMVGKGTIPDMKILGALDSPNTFLFDLMKKSAEAEGLTWTIIPKEGIGALSDHAAFEAAGVPYCYGMVDGEHPGCHEPEDKIDFIQKEVLQMTGELFWHTLRPLSMGEEKAYTDGRPSRPPAANPSTSLGPVPWAMNR